MYNKIAYRSIRHPDLMNDYDINKKDFTINVANNPHFKTEEYNLEKKKHINRTNDELHKEYSWLEKWVIMPVSIVLFPLFPIITGVYNLALQCMAKREFKRDLALARMKLIINGNDKDIQVLYNRLIKTKNQKRFSVEIMKKAAGLSYRGDTLELWRRFKKECERIELKQNAPKHTFSSK